MKICATYSLQRQHKTLTNLEKAVVYTLRQFPSGIYLASDTEYLGTVTEFLSRIFTRPIATALIVSSVVDIR